MYTDNTDTIICCKTVTENACIFLPKLLDSISRKKKIGEEITAQMFGSYR